MSVNPRDCNCDWDSEFDFQWHGPSSICDWTCKVLLLTVYGSFTCLEIVFCGRWRDCLPIPPPTVPTQENGVGDKDGEMNDLGVVEGKGADDGSSAGVREDTNDSKEEGNKEG